MEPSDERLGRRRRRDVERAVAVRVARRDLPELGELVEDEVALVEQVVGLAPDGHLLLDRLVERRELVGVAPTIVAGSVVSDGVLGRGGVREGAEAAVEVLQRAGERLAAGDHGGLGGAVRRVGSRGAPGVPELAEQAEIASSPGSPTGPRRATGRRRVVVFSPSAMFWARYWRSRNESRMRRYSRTSTPWPSCAPAPPASTPAGERVRRRGAEDRLLAGVALGLRVGDVVRRDVEAALLREQAAQRRLQAGEGRDGRSCLQVQDAGGLRPAGGGVRSGDARRARRSRRVGLAAELADEVVEEGELLTHERRG